MDWLTAAMLLLAIATLGGIYQRLGLILHRIDEAEKGVASVKRHLDWIESKYLERRH